MLFFVEEHVTSYRYREWFQIHHFILFLVFYLIYFCEQICNLKLKKCILCFFYNDFSFSCVIFFMRLHKPKFHLISKFSTL